MLAQNPVVLVLLIRIVVRVIVRDTPVKLVNPAVPAVTIRRIRGSFVIARHQMVKQDATRAMRVMTFVVPASLNPALRP